MIMQLPGGGHTSTSFPYSVYQLYDEEDVKKITDVIATKKWEKGHARTPELTSLYKHNEELHIARDEETKELLIAHSKAILAAPAIRDYHIIKRVSTPKFNKYTAPESNYARHTDAPDMNGVRTDLACTTFLSDPTTYEGGELCLEDPNGNVSWIKGGLGHCIVYPCERPHWVNPVVKGERLAIICWLESAIRDLHKREILRSMVTALFKMEEHGMSPTFRDYWTDIGAAHAAILRMWME